MDSAPVNPAGIPVPRSHQTSEIASNPGMSVQEDATDQGALAPREGEASLPLNDNSLAMLGLSDPRRTMMGARSEWDYVTSPTPANAHLAVSPAYVSSMQYSPSEVAQVANYYQNQVLAPTFNQQNILVGNDSGPAVAAEAEARHSAIMNERNEYFREQFSRLHADAMSGAARLRLEFVQAENRLQYQENEMRSAGESMATIHQQEVHQMQKEALDARAKLNQAEAVVSDVVNHAEREVAAKAQAQQAANSMSDQLHQLRAEMAEFMKQHNTQSGNIAKLEKANAELRTRLAGATASPSGIVSVPMHCIPTGRHPVIPRYCDAARNGRPWRRWGTAR